MTNKKTGIVWENILLKDMTVRNILSKENHIVPEYNTIGLVIDNISP